MLVRVGFLIFVILVAGGEEVLVEELRDCVFWFETGLLVVLGRSVFIYYMGLYVSGLFII